MVNIQAQTCPTITLDSPSDIQQGDTVYFFANVSGLKAGVNVTYNWTVSSGYIMSGQGTSYIKVNSNCLGGQYMTATVEIGGLPPECPRTRSASTSINGTPAETQLFTKKDNNIILSIASDAVLFAKDFINAYIILHPSRAVVFLYPGNNITANDFNYVTTSIKKAMSDNGVKPSMYKIVQGGERPKASYEMWIVPECGIEPEPAPKVSTVIFEERFETVTGKWKGRESNQGTVINKDGKLQVISVNKLIPVFIDFPTCILPENFSIEITTKWKAKQTDLFYGYGLGWDPFRFHIFNNGDRRVVFYNYEKNDWGIALNWGGKQSFIKTGVDAENKIKIVCHKNQAEFFINGTLAGTFPIHFKNRILQLMVEGEQTVWFDELIVTALAPK